MCVCVYVCVCVFKGSVHTHSGIGSGMYFVCTRVNGQNVQLMMEPDSPVIPGQ